MIAPPVKERGLQAGLPTTGRMGAAPFAGQPGAANQANKKGLLKNGPED